MQLVPLWLTHPILTELWIQQSTPPQPKHIYPIKMSGMNCVWFYLNGPLPPESTRALSATSWLWNGHLSECLGFHLLRNATSQRWTAAMSICTEHIQLNWNLNSAPPWSFLSLSFQVLNESGQPDKPDRTHRFGVGGVSGCVDFGLKNPRARPGRVGL